MNVGLSGLDLFSGIGGISLALAPWVRTVAYCERDAYAQSVLLSRMAEGRLHCAPIWDDVQTLSGSMLPSIDIIFGGFPCQDISVAGRGVGLEGERSGLVFEIFRLIDECKPAFVFLENVPAIRTRGGEVVGKELARRGFDCRWAVVSAAEVGAPHLRKRWFCLATHAERVDVRNEYWGGMGRKGKVRPSLETMARKNLWPTPRASDGEKGGPNQRGSKGDLALPAAVHWRTPMASGWKNRSSDANRSKRGGQTQLQTQVGGQLNPTWVEWLMGFPSEWTVLDASAIAWFQSKRGKRSKDSAA